MPGFEKTMLNSCRPKLRTIISAGKIRSSIIAIVANFSTASGWLPGAESLALVL